MMPMNKDLSEMGNRSADSATRNDRDTDYRVRRVSELAVRVHGATTP